MIRSERQVLITGCYRSGTEYASFLLSNHPDISVSMYVVSFMRFCYNRYNPVKEKANYYKLVFEAGERIRVRWKRKLNVHKILDYCDNCEKVTYALIYDLMMTDLFLDQNVRMWAEKVQLVWTKIPDFLNMFKQGKAILIIRDPRSVMASFKKFTYAPEPAYLSAVFNCYDSMMKGLEYKATLSPKKFYLVKYEDIIFRPEETLIELFEFLELSSDHDLLSEKGWKDAYGTPWKHNSAFIDSDFIDRKFDKMAFVQRWKDNLTNEDIALCETVNGVFMKTFGYELSRISVPWQHMIGPVLQDIKITAYLNRWISKGEGVEAFPTDPLNPKNWT